MRLRRVRWIVSTGSHWPDLKFDNGRYGKGLAKAGLSYAMKRLAQWHDCAYLATSIGRVGAIQLYLRLGFQPDREHPRALEAWAHFYAVAADNKCK